MEPSTSAEAERRRLASEASRGTPEAVDAWFRAEHPVVYRLSFGFLANAAEAEDVAQDTMLHLLDHLDDWDRERSYAAWRDTVVLNRCRDRLRRNAARGRAHDARAAADAERAAPEPGESLEQRELREVLLDSLTALSEREREVFVLRDLEERSTGATAAALGLADSTVRSLLTLARRRLRGVLARRLPEGELGG